MGIDSYNFFLNSGTTFWLISSWFIVAFFIIILDRFFPKQAKGRLVINYLKGKLFFTFIIRLFFECYFELATSSFLGIQMIDFE